MKSVVAAVTAALMLAVANPAAAALTVGSPAPPFSAPGVRGGAGITVDLGELLKQGPVVVFFFPSAFTDAAECRDFAANLAQFKAAGASVVGMSRDSTDTLTRFSAGECPGEIPLASANESLVNEYDVNDGAMFNTRTTYVIAPSGKIAFVHGSDDHSGHAKGALAFVQGMKK